MIFNACIGIGLNSLYPLAIEAYVEKLYPIRSMLLSTFLISLANVIIILYIDGGIHFKLYYCITNSFRLWFMD